MQGEKKKVWSMKKNLVGTEESAGQLSESVL